MAEARLVYTSTNDSLSRSRRITLFVCTITIIIESDESSLKVAPNERLLFQPEQAYHSHNCTRQYVRNMTPYSKRPTERLRFHVWTLPYFGHLIKRVNKQGLVRLL